MLKATTLLSFLWLFYSPFLNAQINIQWEARYNNTSNVDQVEDYELDASGNSYVTGSSFNGTDYDIVTVKYDNNGNQVWINIYGGSGLDQAKALTIDNNGDIIVTGAYKNTSGVATDWDIFILKINGSTGAQVWSNVYTGSDYYDIGNDVAVNSSNEIYIVGNYNFSSTDLDMIVMRYSSAGSLMSFDSGGGGLSDEGLFVDIDASGNVYVGGTREFTSGSTYFDFRIMKYPANVGAGATWTSYGDSGFNGIDLPSSMSLDNAGNIYIGGQGFTNTAEKDDYLLMKYNNSGSLVWSRLFSGSDGNNDKINALVVDGSSNCYVTGKVKSVSTAEDFMTIKYNSIGDTLWTKKYTTNGLGLDEGTDIILSQISGVYVTGYSYNSSTNNDYYTLKYNETTGAQIWATRFDGPASNSDKAARMAVDAGDNIYISGTSNGGSTNLDYSTIKYCQLETIAPNDTSICLGQSIQLTATSTGGSFQWYSVSGDPISSLSCSTCANPIATPSVTTTYAVSSTSGSGCVDFDTVTVTVNSIPTPTVYNDGPLSFCIGDSVHLYTDSYSAYSWSNGDTDSVTTALTTGTYTVTITDMNGCQASANASVTNFSLPNVSAGADQTICPENTAQLNATGATSYVWDVDPTLSQLLIPNPIANPTINTTYTVTGTDGNGCSASDQVTISLFTSPVVDAGSPTTICVGDSTQLSASGTISYVWDANPTLSNVNISNPWAYPTSQTKYIVTGTDGNGCTARDSVTISTNGLPNVNAGVDQTMCTADSVHIFATGALTYLWQNDPTLSDINSSNPWADPTSTTSYILAGTDINGCTNTDTVTVFVNQLPSVDAGTNTGICPGSSVQLNATGASSYLWTPSSSLTPINIPNPTATPTIGEWYYVTGTDGNGCKNNDSVFVDVYSLPNVDAGNDASICMGDSIQLTASGASTYTWQFDLSLSQLIGASVWANPATQTTYNVTGTDVNGCTGTDQVTITVNPLPSGPTVTHDSIYLITDLSTGIQWYLDGTILPGETNDTLNYTNYSNGVYTAVYIDGNGCMSDTSQSVNPNGNVVIVDVGIEENSLINVSIYPNPSIDIVNIKLNTPIKSILIFDLNGKMILNKNGQNQTQQSIDLSYLPKGSYLLSIQTELGVITRVIIKQ
jgi:hypothetical protein